MPHATTSATPLLRTRAIGAGHLRAFLAVARHLNFRAAADELAVTQSAVSRQIQSLEDEVGIPLFLRHSRAVELTGAGAQLLHAAQPALESIDATVRQIRQTAGRKSVAITTWASFAAMWLIPRLEAFQRTHPDIDIRIDTGDAVVDLETTDVDLAIRYSQMPATSSQAAQPLFGEELVLVASPSLLKAGPALRTPADAAHYTLIETGDVHRMPQLEWLSWQRWFAANGCDQLQPPRWLYFNYAHQIVQAALAGQGLAIARLPLVADALAAGELMEVLPAHRLASPLSYWLLQGPRSGVRPEVQAFCQWLIAEAEKTSARMTAARNT
ncbi:LysR family transcriptional regulator [Comamonas sp. Y33R10-2]|uniref:LysR substrate-binding domain-containing protein n=1 Tax=Comamonas sp. Y33R10-2 TaxID=2853257 RepID=UPI001C5CA3E7|nr:LysR substrate-binding domain-containing protein [Comamonas sp. Y33R10-2]QXZ09773.1 LysR family transcriptional regulator [Comamonas sp. Y33R10-2]